ncbi:MAG: AsmA-like C-terminal region-containing protein [Syntrophales bacterium]|jgi:hypothetical protein|nr:AsmA-like C-terminal region-containing protein [Syntrophales bacterium]MDY0044953.1 AsmA-like C-terminal domain-containing protein [Syntrophales bacterium]
MVRYRTGLLILCGAIFIAAFLSAGFFFYFNTHPELLGSIVQQNLKRRFGTEVTVGEAKASIYPIPRIELTNVKIGTPADYHVVARRIHARISLRHIILGKIRINRLDFYNPVLRYRLHKCNVRAMAEIDIPPVEVKGGKVIIEKESAVIVLDDIEGSFNSNSALFHLRTMGGEAAVEVHNGITSLQCEVYLRGIGIENLGFDLKGFVDLTSQFKIGVSESFFTVHVNASELSLPWQSAKLGTVKGEVRASGSKGRYNFEHISIKSDFADITGTGSVSGVNGIGSLSESLINVKFGSTKLDYEKIVSLLPLERFPHWLSLLLDRQIRGGNISVSKAAYSGKLNNLFSREFAKGFSVAAVLDGCSFQAGYDDSHVDNISGECGFLRGDLFFRNLTGIAGNSKIESVDLVFHDITDRKLALSVAVDLNMKIADFCTAWKAVMVTPELHGILAPVSNIKAGEIEGVVDIYSDSSVPEPVRIKGRAGISEGSFCWSGREIKKLYAAAQKANFKDPLKVDARGFLDGYQVNELKLTIPKLLQNNAYQYDMTAIFPWTENMPFGLGEHAEVKVIGRGDGPRTEGDIRIKADHVRAGAMRFSPVRDNVKGSGELAAVLWPELHIAIRNFSIHSISEKIGVDAVFTEKKGECEIKGTLDLSKLGIQGSDYRLAGGLVDIGVQMEWERKINIAGNINCRNACIAYNGEQVTLNGPLTVKDTVLSSRDFEIKHKNMSARLSGELLCEGPLLFKGEADLEGVDVKKDSGGRDLVFPAGLSADCAVNFKNALIYGVTIENAHAQLNADCAGIRLSGIRADLESGLIEGSINIYNTGKPDINLAIHLCDVEIDKCIPACHSTSGKIDGVASLDGRIWGNTDSLNGELSFTAREGHIKKYSLLSKIFAVLNPYKIFKSGELDLTGSGFSYNKISSTFKIREGVVHFDDFFFDSDSLQASSAGHYVITDRSIDAAVIVEPLESVDKLLGLIPLVGWILTGEKNRFIVVALTVKGNIENPSVDFAPVDTLSEPVTGILLRVLKLPLDIIKNFKNMIPSLSDKIADN